MGFTQKNGFQEKECTTFADGKYTFHKVFTSFERFIHLSQNNFPVTFFNRTFNLQYNFERFYQENDKLKEILRNNGY